MQINSNVSSVVTAISCGTKQEKSLTGNGGETAQPNYAASLRQISFYQSVPTGIANANIGGKIDGVSTKFDTNSYVQLTGSYQGSTENMSSLNAFNKNDIALLESMGGEFCLHSSGALEINPPELRSFANSLADARWMTLQLGYQAPNDSYAAFAAGGMADASILSDVVARLNREFRNGYDTLIADFLFK